MANKDFLFANQTSHSFSAYVHGTENQESHPGSSIEHHSTSSSYLESMATTVGSVQFPDGIAQPFYSSVRQMKHQEPSTERRLHRISRNPQPDATSSLRHQKHLHTPSVTGSDTLQKALVSEYEWQEWEHEGILQKAPPKYAWQELECPGLLERATPNSSH
ncbi:hypothetical protein EG328_009705 [Venturia inaequalis]|uniref:Uncharacterized protein n=1 Tax=Venturia inaequalis TaxID=5025 RepID=A0A8H3ZCS2_VENIN|nr:hypothetical protein EG328_009705 [Venturia inaequalis]